MTRWLRRMSTLAVVAVVAAACAGWPGAASLAGSGGTAGAWGDATEMPGMGQLNLGANAVVTSVSCASPGNCGAGGWYAPAQGAQEAFVANQVNGTWQPPEPVPGLAALNLAGAAYVNALSCPAPGDCAAVGTYQPDPEYQLAFIVTEQGGTWGPAQSVPGLSALDTQGYAQLGTVSCASPGDCAAGGSYTGAGRGDVQAFVVDEQDGVWGEAEEVPGTAPLNADGNATTGVISCPAAGECTADGQYTDAAGNTQVFVASETAGTWGAAQELPGLATLNAGAAQSGPLSCGAAGDCGAGGYYTDASGVQQAFVASQSGGTWAGAQQVPGTGSLNATGASVGAISCPARGDCAAVGSFGDSAGVTEAFAVNESGGTWGDAEQIPGTAALNQGLVVNPTAVSCPAAGDCAAGGYYAPGVGTLQAFVVDESGGVWGDAEEVPDLGQLNTGVTAVLNAISCAAVGSCTAGGYYTTISGAQEPFVLSELNPPAPPCPTPATPPSASARRSRPPATRPSPSTTS
jgi:hypothetical protein